MPSRTLVSVDEYLHTSYDPDCDYVDGAIVERNVGETDHSDCQGRMYAYLLNRSKRLNIYPLVEERVQFRNRVSVFPMSASSLETNHRSRC